VKVYKAIESNSATTSTILYPDSIFGSIYCVNDSAGCVLDGESKRRLIYVSSSSYNTLTLRALTFKDGEASRGGGLRVSSAWVDLLLCVFTNCRATGSFGNAAGEAEPRSEASVAIASPLNDS